MFSVGIGIEVSFESLGNSKRIQLYVFTLFVFSLLEETFESSCFCNIEEFIFSKSFLMAEILNRMQLL